ncbi:MarR family transcriptional regulator [Ensifer sp. T173]|jgi:DNA-binding MarR family transcriptional regulator|uniref:MarR family transcriptional regulator n=1 Tax=Ensifer canadensis TaxID=555315 RepID=A0AAW4FW92_9HYPH|nr:MarR family winged helix-turn-helix transcriptional regulator [Ensifer canadensis]MBM3095387.1 MarR family transcriptional regulator [Ensifer canadensis]UBI79246.1 MarR family winged helix-turn-helix transcriptional regulator [Ensifer canadensis]
MSYCYCILLRKASRRVTSLYDDALAPIGVNLAQFSLLRNIQRAEPISLTDLGQRTELDRSTVSRNVKVLEKMELVVMVSGQDQRESAVELSAKGRQVLRDGAPLWDGVQTAIEAKLGDKASAQLTALLQAL